MDKRLIKTVIVVATPAKYGIFKSELLISTKENRANTASVIDNIKRQLVINNKTLLNLYKLLDIKGLLPNKTIEKALERQ